MLHGLYFGGIGIMVLYNMFVFLSTRSQSYLFYSLFVVCAGVYVGSEGGVLLRYAFTNMSFWNNKITLIAIAGANISGLLFVDYFMNLQSNDPRIHRLIRLAILPLLISFVLIFLMPYSVIGVTYTLVSALTSILLMATTVRGIMRRQRESYFYAAAWISLLLGIIVFALMSLGFMPSSFLAEKSVQIGSLVEVTILSFALADRLNQLRIGLKDANEKLAYQIEHVEEQVLVKTRDIRSIMEPIPLGVFSIAGDHSIHKDYSKSVESMFHRSNIAGEHALSVLFDHALLSADKKDQMQAALTHAIGDDLLNFELNRQVFIDQIVMEWQGERRIYSLSWNPVCLDDQRIEKILVTVHDSTRLLALESEAEAQRRELSMIKKILDVPPARFHSFLRQAERLLQECLGIVDSAEKETAAWHIMRMSLHTLKGTARALDFDELSDLCHSLEDMSAEGGTHLKDELKKLDDRIMQYKSLAIEKLGRRFGTNDAIELPIQEVHGLIQDLTRGTAQHLLTLEKAVYQPLEELLSQSLKCAHRLSLELGKPSPHIKLEAQGFGVTQEGHDALTGVFSHLIRNSLDHGLERDDVRRRKGKDPKGTLEVRVFTENGDCFIDFSDDGTGLDMEALRKKGEWLKRPLSQASAQEIGELIFVPELSTRDVVSNVSGRGLGLSAVRETLRRDGGDVSLILSESSQDFVPFLLRLRLPPRVWVRFHEDVMALSA